MQHQDAELRNLRRLTTHSKFSSTINPREVDLVAAEQVTDTELTAKILRRNLERSGMPNGEDDLSCPDIACAHQFLSPHQRMKLTTCYPLYPLLFLAGHHPGDVLQNPSVNTMGPGLHRAVSDYSTMRKTEQGVGASGLTGARDFDATR